MIDWLIRSFSNACNIYLYFFEFESVSPILIGIQLLSLRKSVLIFDHLLACILQELWGLIGNDSLFRIRNQIENVELAEMMCVEK